MTEKTFYNRFIEEMEALNINSGSSVTNVIGICTRAAKRAQMVVDGDLPPVADRGKKE